MQQDDTDSAQDPAVYSATVTHIGLPTGFTARLLPEDRRAAVLERAEARIVTIVLGAVSPQAGPEHLERLRIGLRLTGQTQPHEHVRLNGIQGRKASGQIERQWRAVPAHLLRIFSGLRYRAKRRAVVAEDHVVSADQACAQAELKGVPEAVLRVVWLGRALRCVALRLGRERGRCE